MSNLSNNEQSVDWRDMIRLALIVSIVAAIAAVALVGQIPETAIVVSVIVLATMASWFHMDHASVRR
jgi:4-hydroxybenzoate polyprenyltransferase